MKNWNTIKNMVVRFVVFIASLCLAHVVMNLLFGWGGKFPGCGEVLWWQTAVRIILGLTIFNFVENFRHRKDNEKEKEAVYNQYKEAFDEFDEKTKDAE